MSGGDSAASSPEVVIGVASGCMTWDLADAACWLKGQPADVRARRVWADEELGRGLGALWQRDWIGGVCGWSGPVLWSEEDRDARA